MSETTPIIIDTDPGVDDAIAILMALASKSCEVLGLTVVGGNVPLARGTRNALAILQWVGRAEVPVCRGSARPLSQRFGYSFAFHGASGITRRLPNPLAGPSPERASQFLSQKLQKSPGGISLVALGPLTNLARLLPAAPSGQANPLASAGSLTVMGGAVDSAGNVTPHAEFNFYSDPLAAHRVLNCGVPVTLVDLAACRQVALGREQIAKLWADNVFGQLAIEILKGWFRRDPNRDTFQFYDPLALAVAQDPGLVSTRPVSIDVETEDALFWGRSRIKAEPGNVAPGNVAPGNVSIVNEVDRQGFFALLTGVLGLTGVDPAAA